MNLQGRVAIVTGAAQGIGAAYAKRLAESGAAVVVADWNEEKGMAVTETLRQAGHRADFCHTDVASEESVQALTSYALKQFGQIDLLINNAAIFSTLEMKPFEQISLEEWERVLAVNLTGVFLCCKAVVPAMRQRKYGRIINISSGTVLSGRPYYLHYVATKAGVAGLTRALAREVGKDNITVNTIAPGQTRTEVQRATVTAEQARQTMSQRCIQREQTPEDLVGMVAFLCSDEASFITGQFILIDGGRGMH
ncbi:MAG: 3-oxoacyl-ACP reductase FabG [Alicyclobacillus sp.]|nr:3-oxoacyl-ACP reductase FabG [Alicyclobacillus sp.]